MLRLWFESARAMLFLFILLNALPVPMLRQVFGGLWGSKRKPFLVGFCRKVPLFLKTWCPRFCTPLQRFGLILPGLGPPAGAKKREKAASKLSSFFDVETKAPKPFFII